jgi:hypothetical protein
VLRIGRKPRRQSVHRLLETSLALQPPGLGEAVLDDLLGAAAGCGGSLLLRVGDQLPVAFELAAGLRRVLHDAEPLFRLERFEGRGLLSQVVVGDSQLQIRKVVDDLHPIGAHADSGIPLPFEGLPELPDRHAPLLGRQGPLGVLVVHIPEIGAELPGGQGERQGKDGRDPRLGGAHAEDFPGLLSALDEILHPVEHDKGQHRVIAGGLVKPLFEGQIIG